MSTARIFQLIDLQSLSPELADAAKEANAQSEAMGFDLLHGVVAAILRAEPGHYTSMIGLARTWFTQNLESIERIENAHKTMTTLKVLEGLSTQVVDNCQVARRVALRTLKALNLEYAASQTELGQHSEERFSTLHAAFLAFYREMEEAELHTADAKISARALQARSALEAANRKLKYRYMGVGRLRGRVAELWRQVAGRETKLSSDTNSRALISQVVDGREVFVLEKEELQALHQRINGLVEKQGTREQIIEAIERVNAAIAANRSDEEIQSLMVGTPLFHSVGERWARSVREKMQLQEKMAAIRPLVEAQVKLQADKERYTTRDIAERIYDATGEQIKIDDVAYQLEKLAKEKLIASKKQDVSWFLTTRDLEVAMVHITTHVRNKAKRRVR